MLISVMLIKKKVYRFVSFLEGLIIGKAIMI